MRRPGSLHTGVLSERHSSGFGPCALLDPGAQEGNLVISKLLGIQLHWVRPHHQLRGQLDQEAVPGVKRNHRLTVSRSGNEALLGIEPETARGVRSGVTARAFCIEHPLNLGVPDGRGILRHSGREGCDRYWECIATKDL